MSPEEEAIERLRAAVERTAAADAVEVVAEARAQARSRARSILVEALTKSMLDAARSELERSAPSQSEPPLGGGPRGAATEPTRARNQDEIPRPEPSASPRPETGEAWYVYGVIASGGAGVPGGVGGVNREGEVEILAVDDLAAIVSRVPLAEFNEDQLRANLSDMAWVERVARGHEEVLEAAGARQTLVPMRMCSIYRDRGRVESMLVREREWLRAALQDLQGRAEWGVKVFAAPRQRAGTAVESEGEPASGAAYMERRRREQSERGRVDEDIASASEAIFARLSSLSSRALVVPPQRPEVSGHSGDMVLNSVYLVPNDELEAFHVAVTALQDEHEPLGLEIIATGPWPAYNFVPDATGASG